MTPRWQARSRPAGGALCWAAQERRERGHELGERVAKPAICRDRSPPPPPLCHPCRHGYERGVQGCWPGEPSCPSFPFPDPYTVLATGQSW